MSDEFPLCKEMGLKIYKVVEWDDGESLSFQSDVICASDVEAMLKAALIDGGYNSTRETVALMAEDEGLDWKVYVAMARSALVGIDLALKELGE